MSTSATSTRVLSLALSTAMTGALLSGCANMGGINIGQSSAKSESSRALAQASKAAQKAVAEAEAAVLAAPHDAEARAALGDAYLDAGRFASAATTFEDAIHLGDASGHTMLGLALAELGQGRLRDAAAVLNERGHDIPSADLGLALALAGQPDRGIHVLSSAIRGGENTVKTRQNLAYAYALAGRWRESRLMAQQDVPADKVGERMEQWAIMAQPDAWQLRVAGLLQVPAGVPDAGQPVHLALGGAPAPAPLAAETIELAVAEPAAETYSAAIAGELPPLVAAQPVAEIAPLAVAAPAPVASAPQTFETAFAAPASLTVPAALPAPRAAPVAQDTAAFAPPPALRAKPSLPVASARASTSTHLVQLGAFSTEAGARRAWSIYTKRYPQLVGHKMVISEAVVSGKHVWRVSAGGYGRTESAAMCGHVKSRGEGCFAYAEGRPLPGAIDRGTRLAMR